MPAKIKLTDCDIVKMCVAVYNYPDQEAVTFDHFEQADATNGNISWALKRVDDEFYVIYPGTENLLDVYRDLMIIANPCIDKYLGPVHPGFMQGLPTAWKLIKKTIGVNYNTKLILGGHSLGAAHAALSTGMALFEGIVPLKRVVIGQPHIGFKQVYEIIGKVPYSNYFNTDGTHFDIVPTVPPAFGPELYVNGDRQTKIYQAPDILRLIEWSIAAWHYSPLYLQGVRKLYDYNPIAPHLI
jgi:Lipase (class 3)